MIALNCCVQVVDILKTSGNADLFSPEMDSMRHKEPDPGLDLLGALLAVSLTQSQSQSVLCRAQCDSYFACAARDGSNCC